MDVTAAMIDNLSNLSRLHFTELEKDQVKEDLQRMIAFVEKLGEVDTTGVVPLQHMTAATDIFREDEVRGSMDKAIALSNAPAATGDYFTVPQVIKK